jgi:hypothetical protein
MLLIHVPASPVLCFPKSNLNLQNGGNCSMVCVTLFQHYYIGAELFGTGHVCNLQLVGFNRMRGYLYSHTLKNTTFNNQHILPVTEKFQQERWSSFSETQKLNRLGFIPDGELCVAVDKDEHAEGAQGGADGGGRGRGRWLAAGETASRSMGGRRGGSPDSCSS